MIESFGLSATLIGSGIVAGASAVSEDGGDLEDALATEGVWVLMTGPQSGGSALPVRFIRLTIIPTVKGPTMVHSRVAQMAM